MRSRYGRVSSLAYIFWHRLSKLCLFPQVNRLLEEADHNAGLGDPAYLPEMDTTTETFATHDTSRDTVESAVDDTGHSVGDTSRGTKENGPQRNRFSANTASTNGDFFEAHDGRTSTDV